MNGPKSREEIWEEMYEKHAEEKTGEVDFRGFADLFAEKGMKGYDKGEKQFGSPDKSKIKLKNFTYPKDPESKLDLHGEIVADVPRLVEKYLLESREQGKTFVLVIFGIGRNNPEGKSKLRPVVVHQLLDMRANQRIKDYKTADPKDGGFGAIYVYLK